jgi:hypothetical protein
MVATRATCSLVELKKKNVSNSNGFVVPAVDLKLLILKQKRKIKKKKKP